MSSSPPPLQTSCSKTSSSRRFLSLPDVIRERIYFFVLTVNVDARTPWITPLPSSRHIPKHVPDLPPKPDCNLENVSKSVRKKRRRRMRAFERTKQQAIVAARAAAPSSCLAILATCRTILLEAFHLWYRTNTLNFCRSKDVYSFLASIGSARANEIRSIRLDIPGQEWDDGKATYALQRLRGLEKIIFIYNDFNTRLVAPRHISFPRIISHLRGLQQVTFADPENPKIYYGHPEGMTECVKARMEELGRKMTTKPKKPKPAPPMIDLFNRLRIVEQQRRGDADCNWEEGLSYAPDLNSESLLAPGNIVEYQ